VVADVQGRIVDSQIANDRTGRITAKLTYDVPLTAATGIVERAKGIGKIRVQQLNRDVNATDGKFATARIDLTLSNVDPIVASDDGLWPQVRKGLSYSANALLASVSWVIFGLCVVLPWMIVGYVGYRVIRWSRRGLTEPSVPSPPQIPG
jgi:Domain of unknown function (DUF4349)